MKNIPYCTQPVQQSLTAMRREEIIVELFVFMFETFRSMILECLSNRKNTNDNYSNNNMAIINNK